MGNSRDLTQWFRASFVGALVCVALYTAYGFILVSRHAAVLTSQMELFVSAGMTPLVAPGDPYITTFGHKLGSALFFGATLGLLNALMAMLLSLAPWLKGRLTLRDGILLLALGGLCTYFGYSGEFQVLSFLFGFACPLFYFVPWALIIRKSRPREVNPASWVVMACITASPFVVMLTAGTSSFESIRDTMITLPVMRGLSDFYYDHTLLAAHVIKPLEVQEQKAIAVMDDVSQIGPIPHGSLWIITPDPCGVKGRSITVSRESVSCESIVLPDGRPANVGNRIIREYGKAYDKNENMRQGIGVFFFSGPILLIPLFFLLWFALFLSNLLKTHAWGLALLVLAAYMLAFLPVWKNLYDRQRVEAHPEKLATYILSEHEQDRYLALSVFPDLFSNAELIRFSRDESPRIRLSALVEAGRRSDEKFVDAFAKGLKDPQQNVRTKACWGLSKLNTPEASDLLQQAFMKDSSWYVRGYAFRALGKTRPMARILRTGY